MKKTINRILVAFLALVIFSVNGFPNGNQAHVVKHTTVHRHHKGHHKHKHHRKGHSHSHKKHFNKRR